MASPVDPPLRLEPPKRYAAFISYRHGQDLALADAIQTGLQRLKKRWNQRRALEVFRDDTGLGASPALWPSICTAMDGADWLVLLASPESAQSSWVGKEIHRWIATKGADRILTVVTAGTWRWDEAVGDIDWSVPPEDNAAHPALRGAFAHEPRHLDMTWARTAKTISLHDPHFRGQVAELAATMHGTTKDELVGEDIRQHSRTKLLARSAVGTLATLTAISLVASLLAVQSQRTAVIERDRAQVQSLDATSRRLAALSTTIQGPDGALQYLLAAQAYRSAPTAAARGALFNAALGDERGQVGSGDALLGRLVGHDDGVLAADFDPSGAQVATLDGAGVARVWSLDAAEDPVVIDVPGATMLVFAAPGMLVVGAPDGLDWYDAASGESTGTQDAAGSELTALSRSVQPGRVVVGDDEGGIRTIDATGQGASDAVEMPSGVRLLGADASGATIVAYAEDGTVEVRDGEDLSVRSSWTSPYELVAVSPDGAQVAMVDSQGDQREQGFAAVHVRSVTDGQIEFFAATREYFLATSATFLPGSDEMIVGTTGGADNAPGQAFRFKPPDELPVGFGGFTVPPTVTTVLASPDGSAVLIAGDDGVAYVNGLETRELQPVLPLSATSEGRLVLVHTEDGLGTADIDSGEITAIGAGDGGVLSPDGSVVVTTDGRIIDVATGEARVDGLGSIDLAMRPAFTGDSGRIAYVQGVGSVDNRTVAVADLRTGDVVSGESPVPLCNTTLGCESDPGTLSLSLDGNRVAISSYLDLGANRAMRPGVFAIVDVSEGWVVGPEVSLPGSGPTMFSADGQRLLAHDGQRVWDLDATTLEPRGSGFINDAGGVWSLDPERVQLAAVQPCGVTLVDPETWTPVATVPWSGLTVEGQGCLGTTASWTGGGSLLTVDYGSECNALDASECALQVWPTDPAELLPRVCALAGRNMTREEWSQFLPEWPYALTCPAFAEPRALAGSDPVDSSVPASASPSGSSQPSTPAGGPPPVDEPGPSTEAPAESAPAALAPVDAYIALLAAGDEPFVVSECVQGQIQDVCVVLLAEDESSAVLAIAFGGNEVGVYALLRRTGSDWVIEDEHDPFDESQDTPQWVIDARGGL